MREGFVYASAKKAGPMANAIAGVRVAKTDLGPPWENADPYLDSDHSRTLAIPGVGRPVSPIGGGLTLISSLVFERARQFGGATVDEEEEWVLNEPWVGAQRVLQDAAMAAGAPSLFDSAG